MRPVSPHPSRRLLIGHSGRAGQTLGAVIFDMDGVLLDSEPLHHRATNAILREEDRPPLSLAEYTRYLGRTDEDMWRDLRSHRELGRPHEHYLQRFGALVLAAYRQHAAAAPGAVALLDWLTACGVPLAVASSSRTEWVETCLDTISIRRYFGAVVGGDMVTRGKPDPEIFLLAARRLDAEPGTCVVLEDSPAGVAAAARAGMLAFAVCTAYTPPGLVTGARATVHSLAEVPRALRELTIARRPATVTTAPAASEARHADLGSGAGDGRAAGVLAAS
jgi:HAD superfamily hydrolase (TIGR01509 family)